MYISRILIKNFRTFSHLDVPLQPGTNVIIGENNTGKTNLLYAIRLPLDANLSSQYRKLTEQDFNSKLDLTKPQQVIVSLEFTDFSARLNEAALVESWGIGDDQARLTYRFRPNKTVRQEIESEERSPTGLIIEDDYAWEITGGGEKDPVEVKWDENLGSAVRFFDLQSFHVLFLDALRNVQQDLRQIRASPLGRLLTATSISEVEKNQLIKILQSANSKISKSKSISEAGNAIEESFEDVAGEAFAMGVQLGMADPSFTSITRSLTLLLSNDVLKDFEPFRNGLGLNNILYVSMILEYFQKRVTVGKTAGQLLLIEEPEAHIHPQLQRVLCGALSNKPFQTFLTTHSTHISSYIPIKSCVVLTKTSGGEISSSLPANQGEFTAREIADLDRYLDATKSTLLFARKVMLVEGPAELFLIPALVKKVLDKDFDRLGISIIPIYGVHFSVYAKLFGTNGIRKKCAIVADGDLQPSDSRDEGEGEDDLVLDTSLADLKSEYVRVFQCNTTFERSLTITGLLPLLAETCGDFGATKTEKALKEGYKKIKEENLEAEKRKPILSNLAGKVLSLSKRVGKARFSQVASSHIDLAESVPKYIRTAVDWLTSP